MKLTHLALAVTAVFASVNQDPDPNNTKASLPLPRERYSLKEAIQDIMAISSSIKERDGKFKLILPILAKADFPLTDIMHPYGAVGLVFDPIFLKDLDIFDEYRLDPFKMARASGYSGFRGALATLVFQHKVEVISWCLERPYNSQHLLTSLFEQTNELFFGAPNDDRHFALMNSLLKGCRLDNVFAANLVFGLELSAEDVWAIEGAQGPEYAKEAIRVLQSSRRDHRCLASVREDNFAEAKVLIENRIRESNCWLVHQINGTNILEIVIKNCSNTWGLNPTEQGMQEIMDFIGFLLRLPGAIDLFDPSKLVFDQQKVSKTMYSIIAVDGCQPLLKLLVDNGFNLNWIPDQENTVDMAISCNKLQMVDFYIQHNEQFIRNVVGHPENRFLKSCMRTYNFKAFRTFLRMGAYQDPKFQFTPSRRPEFPQFFLIWLAYKDKFILVGMIEGLGRDLRNGPLLEAIMLLLVKDADDEANFVKEVIGNNISDLVPRISFN